MITCTLTPRPYQAEAVNIMFELFDSGTIGVLVRSFTGSGKTPMACMAAERWLNLDGQRKVMVISYERQLVWQFGQEVEDFLRITPGIEMGNDSIDRWDIPDVVICSRQSLLRRKGPNEEQVRQFERAGIGKGLYSKVSARRAVGLLNLIDEGQFDSVLAELEGTTAYVGPDDSISRLYKFDHKFDWLVIYDEAHKHAYHLKSIEHIVEWFDLNPLSRRLGLTATPRRSDRVSIGHKMFPGVALDYPMHSTSGKSAVKDGYSVPLIQKYISVEGVDFTKLSKVGQDFSPDELEGVLNTEKKLAELCEPLLDMCEARRTLIFSPTVKMAGDVADYLNARARIGCECGKFSWHPRHLIGDGAKCKHCGRLVEPTSIIASDQVCRMIYGETPINVRAETYRGHQQGEFQFLSVCGLCKEGYNDPDIACVAIFRPVSEKAVSLAEQMKGRGSRPLRGLIEGLESREQRLDAIKGSDKPNCLIIDLVGVSGLQDCATTAQIYLEGEPDEVVRRVEQLMLEGEEDVSVATEKVKEEIEAEKEARRQQIAAARQAAEELANRRAKAGAHVDYSVHDTGTWDRPQGATLPNGASEKQLKFIESLGLDLAGYPITKNQAGRIISQLLEGKDIEQVKYMNMLPKELKEAPGEPATIKQLKFLQWKGIKLWDGMTKREASKLIEKIKKGNQVETHKPYKKPMPSNDYHHLMEAVADAASNDELSKIARIIKRNREDMDDNQWQSLIRIGKERRDELCQPNSQDHDTADT